MVARLIFILLTVAPSYLGPAFARRAGSFGPRRIPASGAEPAARRVFERLLFAVRSSSAARALYISSPKTGETRREWSDREDISMSEANNHQLTNRRSAWNMDGWSVRNAPLRPKEVWNIRARLQIEARIWDLAMFNLAIDSKLPGCDLVGLKIENYASAGGCATLQRSSRRRPAGRFNSNSRIRPGRR